MRPPTRPLMRLHAFLALLLLALLPGLAAPALAADSSADATLRAKLIGRWQERRELDCETHQQNIQMRADGTFEVRGVISTCTGDRSFVWRGTWLVIDSRLRYTTTASEPPGEFQIGEQWEDQILSVTEAEWLMREQSTGNRSRAVRVK